MIEERLPVQELIRWAGKSPYRSWWIEPVDSLKIKFRMRDERGSTAPCDATFYVKLDPDCFKDNPIYDPIPHGIKGVLNQWERKHGKLG